jgi:AraC-like DNA-binding protein
MAVMGIQYGERLKIIRNGTGAEQWMDRSGVGGLQTEPRLYRSSGKVGTIIIRFKPGGLRQFTSLPISEFKNANVSLHYVFDRALVDELEDRVHGTHDPIGKLQIAEAFLLKLYRDHAEDPLVREAVAHMQLRHGRLFIDEIAKNLYTSKRTLERKFNEAIGLSPKQYANVLRFQLAIRLRKTGSSWLDIVHACRYSDQAHFITEFRSFSGCSPEQFFQKELQPDLSTQFNGDSQSKVSTTMYH